MGPLSRAKLLAWLPVLLLSACASMNKSQCLSADWYASGRAGHGRPTVCPESLAANFDAGYGDGRQRYDLTRRLDAVHEQMRQSKAALKAGIPDSRQRAREVERLEQALAGLPGR